MPRSCPLFGVLSRLPSTPRPWRVVVTIVVSYLLMLSTFGVVAKDRSIISIGDFSWAPYLILDNKTGNFRIFYLVREAGRQMMVVRESTDGVLWSKPHVVRSEATESGVSWGASVIDTGTAGSRRFRNMHYWIGPGKNGAYVSTSSNGVDWLDPVERRTPVVDSDDQLNPFPLPNGRYGLFTKPRDTRLRETWVSFGDANFENWSAPIPAFQRDENDPENLEFYGAACCVVRGNKLVAFLRILRDDLERGVGYTVLAWSEDQGKTWTRSRRPFLTRCAGSKDQAHAWIYGVVEREGTIYFSYSAYPQGHKAEQRYVGVATMPSEKLMADGAASGPACDFTG